MNIEKEEQTTKMSMVQTLARVGLGSMLLFTGTTHLTVARKEFQAQVPDWVPMDKDVVVLLSGVAELLLGGSLAGLPRYKVVIGWIAAAFFVAVFPGNVYQYTHHINAFNLDTDQKRMGRLFMQPVFVAWALWSTGAWQAWRNAPSN